MVVVDFDDMGGAESAKNSYQVRSFLEIQDLKAIMGYVNVLPVHNSQTS